MSRRLRAHNAAVSMLPSHSVRFLLPAPALRDCVTSYYALDAGDASIDDWLHPEWANIRFALKGRWGWSLAGAADPSARAPRAALFGPMAHAARITAEPGAALFGLGLSPLGWARLMCRPASAFANRMVALEDLVGKEAGELLEGLEGDADDRARAGRMDAWLGARLADAPAADPHLAPIHRALLSGEIETVSAFAASVAVTERTLERLCPRYFGFAPKPLLRRQRFLRNLDQLQRHPDQSVTRLLDDSYVDQSHFVREFRAFMGMAPSQYFGLPRTLMREASKAREAVIGQALQGLHAPPAQPGSSSE